MSELTIAAVLCLVGVKSAAFAMSAGVLTTIVVIGLLILFAPIMWWIVKRSNAKFAQLWPALTPIVNGSFKREKMTGTYNGMPVQVKNKAVRRGRSRVDYFYELQMMPGAQAGQDWTLHYDQGLLGLGVGGDGWEIKTRDEQLKERLMRAGAMNLARGWSQRQSINYDAGKGTITYNAPVRSLHDLPAPDVFKTHLDTLAQLANVTRQVGMA